MSGGIFTETPFVLNPKCIVFSFYSALLFYAGGGSSLLLIALIFVVSYVLLSWYDFIYECTPFMKSGTGYGLQSNIFKPQYRKKNRDIEEGRNTQNLVADQEKAYLNKVYFFHAFVVAPLLLYVGYMGAESHNKIWGLIGGMGGLAFMYHGFRLGYPREVWK